MLHVLGALVELEPAQAQLLERIGTGPLITATDLAGADALRVPQAWRKTLRVDQGFLFDAADAASE